jgi:hypothetical protein
MTARIIAVSPHIHNPNPARRILMRFLLWLLNRYAEHGFHLSVDNSESYLYLDGQRVRFESDVTTCLRQS